MTLDKDALEISIPNLDALEPEELREFDEGCMALAAMASMLRAAKMARLKGDVESALRYERDADRRFKMLPEWARW